jgi:hypothetical protein
VSLKSQWLVLTLALVGYLGLFGWFYPPLPGIEDEVGFLNLGYALSRGTANAHDLGYEELQGFKPTYGRLIGWRNPGRALTVVPFFWCDATDGVFWSGAAIHVATTLAAGLLLRALGRSPLWAVLVLAHPTLALYSRTVMADGLCGLFFTIAAWSLARFERPGLIAGLAVGLACVCRYQAAVVLPFVTLLVVLSPRIPNRTREAVKFLVGAGVVGVGIAAYNVSLFESVVGPTQQGYFRARFVLPHLLLYATCLGLIWPGMLFAVLHRGPSQRLILAFGLPYVGFLLPYFFHDTGSSWVETAVVAPRIISPVLPVWIVGYAVWCADGVRWIRARVGVPDWSARVLVVTAVVALLAAVAALFARHQSYLNDLAAVRTAAAVIPDGADVAPRGGFHKLFAMPFRSGPHFRFVPDPTQADARPGPRVNRLYLADVPRRAGGAGVSPEELDRLRQTYRVTPIPVAHPRLTVYLLERLEPIG